MKTLLANLKHAARNKGLIGIGGGTFTSQDLDKAIGEIEQAVYLLQRVTDLAEMSIESDEDDDIKASDQALIATSRLLLEKLK